MEARCARFHGLSQNRWFPRFNLVLYELRLLLIGKKRMRPGCLEDATEFFLKHEPIPSKSPGRPRGRVSPRAHQDIPAD
jgi:hypothetical protein